MKRAFALLLILGAALWMGPLRGGGGPATASGLRRCRGT